jgi:hypothetical protein
MGEAIAQRLAAAGVTIGTTARSEIAPGHSTDLFVRADLSTADGVARAGRVRRAVDVLINNVVGSAAPSGGFAALTDEEWYRELDTKLKQGAGVVAHISSIQRRLPLFEATLAYAAAKALLTASEGHPVDAARRLIVRPRGTTRGRCGASSAGAHGLARRDSDRSPWSPGGGRCSPSSSARGGVLGDRPQQRVDVCSLRCIGHDPGSLRARRARWR